MLLIVGVCCFITGGCIGFFVGSYAAALMRKDEEKKAKLASADSEWPRPE